MVRFLISTTFLGTAFIRRRCLFQIWRLLEEIMYTLIRNAFFLALERKFWDFNINFIMLFLFINNIMKLSRIFCQQCWNLLESLDSVLKSFEHCYSKNDLNKISSTFSKLVITGIEHLIVHDDRSVIKRSIGITTSTASGQVDTSGQTSTTSW